MSLSRLWARSASLIVRANVCVFCHARQLSPFGRVNNSRLLARVARSTVFMRTYAQKLDVMRLRADVDKKARVGWFAMMKKEGVLLVEADKAIAIYNDFVAHKDRREYGKLVKQFTTKYGVTFEDIAGMALVTYSIPDLSDSAKRAMLPPSQHKNIAGLILQGCAENHDPLAIKHILTAVYLNTHTTAPGARDVALLFPKSEILKYRQILEKLSGKDDPEASTLQGLFAERENQQARARLLYEKAMQVKWAFIYAPRARHPLQLPLIAPWNALGYLLKVDRDPAVRAQAKSAFEQGAHKADDPLSCYELAAFLDRSSAEWLKCISKAAASGHLDAQVQLAQFYRDISPKDSSLLLSGKLKQTLDWLLGWRKGSAEMLAVEWFEVAGNAGHKGALMQLADLYESLGEKAKAREVLQRIVEPAGDVKVVEEWQQVVHQAKGRLSGVKTA